MSESACCAYVVAELNRVRGELHQTKIIVEQHKRSAEHWHDLARQRGDLLEAERRRNAALRGVVTKMKKKGGATNE